MTDAGNRRARGDRLVDEKSWQVIRYVNTPLGFFALALLLLYGFLVAAGVAFQISETWRVILIAFGGLAFTGVVGSVVWLAARHPTGLVFGEQTQLRYQQLLYGSDEKPLTGEVLEVLPRVAAPQTQGEQRQLPEGR